MRASQEDRWLSARKESIRRLRKHESAIEQKRQADQAAAEQLLKARKESRRRQDELMRKPWKKPSAPTKDILKRGDGARRRLALRRSIEKAAGQVEKTMPAMCRWNRATAETDRGLRDFIDKQRAARKTSVSVDPQLAVATPQMPWNDVKATAQQRLLDLVRGQRFDIDIIGSPNDHDSHGAAESLVHCLQRSSEIHKTPGDTQSPQACEVLGPGCAKAESKMTSAHSAESNDRQEQQHDMSHTMNRPSGVVTAGSQSVAELSAQHAPLQTCRASSHVVAPGLPVTFGELLRQSMSVANVNSCRPIDNQTRQPGCPNSKIYNDWETGMPPAQGSTSHTSTCVPQEPVVDGVGPFEDSVGTSVSIHRDGPAACNQEATRARDACVHPQRDTVLEQRTSMYTEAAGAAIPRGGDSSSAKDKNAYGERSWGTQPVHLGKRTTLLEDSCSEQIRSGVHPPSQCDVAPNDTHLPAQGGDLDTCCKPDSTSTPSEVTMPASSSHTIRLQMLMEKMESLKQLHKHVQQELQSTQITSRGASAGTCTEKQPLWESVNQLTSTDLQQADSPRPATLFSTRNSATGPKAFQHETDSSEATGKANSEAPCADVVSRMVSEATTYQASDSEVRQQSCTDHACAPVTTGKPGERHAWQPETAASGTRDHFEHASAERLRVRSEILPANEVARQRPAHDHHTSHVSGGTRRPDIQQQSYRLALSDSRNQNSEPFQDSIARHNQLAQPSCMGYDQSQGGGVDTSLRSWVPSGNFDGSASPQQLLRRTDSAMQSRTRQPSSCRADMKTPCQVMDSKIPQAPSPGSVNGVSLAPIDLQAFTRIPGGKRQRDPCAKSLRSSFDLEFQDLANDPEVLAMIDSKHQHGPVSMCVDPKLLMPAPAVATGKRAQHCPDLFHCRNTTKPCRPGIPSHKALIKSWVNRVQDAPGCGRQILLQESIRTDVSDEINMLQASLDRLDLKIAQTRWPGLQSDLPDEQHAGNPAFINYMNRVPLARPNKHTVDGRSLPNRRQKAYMKNTACYGAHSVVQASTKPPTTHMARGTNARQAGHELKPTKSLHRTKAVKIKHKDAVCQGNKFYNQNDDQKEQPDSAMRMEDAHQIWTQVLLAGVMATFGRHDNYRLADYLRLELTTAVV